MTTSVFPINTRHDLVTMNDNKDRLILAALRATAARRQVSEFLRNQRYQVSSIADTLELLEAVRKNRPDLILLDSQLEPETGFSLCRYLKEHLGLAEVPILLLLPSDHESLVEQAITCRADEWFIVPVLWKNLQYRIRYHLDRADKLNKLRLQVASLRQERCRAESASRVKSAFLASMSHDLLTPMHGILSYAGFGLKRVNTASREKLEEFFLEIEASGSRLLRLLNDLLDLARLESNRITYDMRLENLVAEVENVLDEFIHPAAERQITLKKDLPGTPVPVRFDRLRIGQVLRNLLNNSLKFSPAGTVIRVSLRLHAGTDDTATSLAEVAVSDQGVGIPQGELAAIFDAFGRNNPGKSGTYGSGLGLAICKHIIEDHKGRIEARPNPGKGVIFSFFLPVTENDNSKEDDHG